MQKETVNDNLFASAIRLLQVTSFLTTTNRQAFPTQLRIKQLTLYKHHVTLAAEVLDVGTRHVETLRHLLVIFHLVFQFLVTEIND